MTYPFNSSLRGHQEPESSCLAPRATAIQKQDFSVLGAAGIVQPELSMSCSCPFLSNSANQVSWTSGHPL